jgi:hypothetical protein
LDSFLVWNPDAHSLLPQLLQKLFLLFYTLRSTEALMLQGSTGMCTLENNVRTWHLTLPFLSLRLRSSLPY